MFARIFALRMSGFSASSPDQMLGICAVRAVERPDLRDRLSASDRERPLVTGLMAR
jgi:hypothetical protein